MPPNPMIERSRRGPYDELNTPPEALTPLLRHLPLPWVIWEAAPGPGNLARALEDCGWKVSFDQEADFLTSTPFGMWWDCIVTNPPFSKKIEFLTRCEELEMPWALLLPVTTLGVRKCQPHLEGAEIIFLPRRIDFTGKKAPWFAVAWFTKGLNIGKQLVFD